MLKMFPHKDLHMKNMNGSQGKTKICQEYQDKVRLGLHMVYGDEYEKNSIQNWNDCVKAIDKKLRQGNGKHGERYTKAKLSFGNVNTKNQDETENRENQ